MQKNRFNRFGERSNCHFRLGGLSVVAGDNLGRCLDLIGKLLAHSHGNPAMHFLTPALEQALISGILD